MLFQSFVYTGDMNRDKALTFADHTGRFYAERYGFPPVVGRLIGYLYVCQPMEQSINDLAQALLASRSAITNAVKTLETQKLIQRSRPAGTRFDLISLDPLGWQNVGFDPSEYLQMAGLAREGLELLGRASPQRRQALEAVVSLNEFLAEKLPQLYEEWSAHYQKSRAAKRVKGS